MSGSLPDPPAGTIVFDHASVTGLDLHGASIPNYLAVGSEFIACDFRESVFGAGILGDIPLTTYRECDFSGADLRHVSPQFARFESCLFAGTNLLDWNAMSAEFINCRFVGLIIGARFSGRPVGVKEATTRIERLRSINEFRGNDFSEAVLDDCSIVGGIELDANQWPRSTQLTIVRDWPATLARVRPRLDELDDANRAAAQAVITILSMGGFQFQRDLIIDTKLLAPLAPLLSSTT